MSSLEERARAAVRATAAEIRQEDVPPMRGPGAGDGAGDAAGGADRRRRHTRQGFRPAGARQWGVPLAAAAGVLAVVAAAGLLAGVLPSHAPRSAASASKSAGHPAKSANAPAYPGNLASGLIGLFLPATGAQYSAGALFTGDYRALEGKITSLCMTRLGFPAPPVQTPAEIARPFWDLTQYPDLGAIAKAGTLPSYSMPASPTESKAYQDAYNQCTRDSLSPFAPMVRAGRKLGDPFMLTVANIQSSAAVNATLPALRTCAARYGWPSQPYGAPDSTINSLGDFVDWVAGHLDGAGSRGASNAEMNALSRHWAVVFVRCARPTVAVMERLQLAAQRAYLGEHQRQFAALVATARADFVAGRADVAMAERLAGQRLAGQ